MGWMLGWWLVSIPLAVVGCWLMSKYKPGRVALTLIPLILFVLLPGVLTILMLLLLGFVCGIPRVSKWVNPYFDAMRGGEQG